MQDPERLSNATSDADALEREVLAQLRRTQAPATAKAMAWQGIAAGIAAAGAATALGSAATASATTSASANLAPGAKATTAVAAKLMFGATTKLVLAAAVSVAAVSGAVVVYRQDKAAHVREGVPSPRPSPSPSPRLSPNPSPREEIKPPRRQDAKGSEIPSAGVLAPWRSKSESESETSPSTKRLSAESALLSSARAQLRNGDAASATRTLDRLRQRFPNGALLQEREVLRIETLTARGEHEAAKRAARAFVRRYPNSPHSTQLRVFLTAPPP